MNVFARVRRSFVVGAVLVTLAGAAAPAGAAVKRSERAALDEIIAGMVGRSPTRTTSNCVANRLPAGAVENVLVDAIFTSGDATALADSIPFRKVMRAIFLCKPAEVTGPIAAGLVGPGFTSRQATCFAKNFVGRLGADDNLLTLVIRGGVQNLSFENEDSIVAVNALAALKGCVPASRYPELAAEILLELAAE